MFPSEMVILMAIAARESGRELLTRPVDVQSKYIGYLYDSLVRRGYIQGSNSKGYQLTPEGRDALFEFLYKNKTRVKDTIRTLQRLGIEISQAQEQRIGKLEKEVTNIR